MSAYRHAQDKNFRQGFMVPRQRGTKSDSQGWQAKKNPTEAGLIFWRRLFAEFSENFVADSFYRTDTFDAMITRSPGAARPVFVVRRQRFGLFVIDLQTLANCFFLVVDALDQRFACTIVAAVALRGVLGEGV